ncbi:Uncharacterised protein [Mycobacteroides abscessus subsp. abscessus]|nr:Uncharacterised protein [Mycobacteroides abscessus subsp. abscessus]
MMIAQLSTTGERLNQSCPHDVSATYPPATMANRSSTTPITDTSLIRPGRRYRR